jgi:hypothetical protein
VLLEGRVVHSPDVLADSHFTYGDAQKLAEQFLAFRSYANGAQSA